MEEKRKSRVIVDTYAILAMAYGQLGREAERILLGIRRGDVEGLMPSTAVYELFVHWLRGRIPALKTVEEVKTFLTKYFTIVVLGIEEYVEAAKIKVEGV